jgi:hypothetical protein
MSIVTSASPSHVNGLDPLLSRNVPWSSHVPFQALPSVAAASSTNEKEPFQLSTALHA